ncbi:YCF48-related protein [Aureibaculum sp. 2210JD6-5]|uniref:WD40/YVTN/BNR-like repeat-containing protein n=1 Tax=Aureibaculum sp. 2210JD6-5 TaxID=3103957 RepID=UPI002AAE7500|nr:YCF48-related protein [Aureibaculum sp. 2210JD6-5]MDY7396331.1 YCF48-related protein [Aureibaculum sp. 2210JD6-5]
MKIIKLYLFLLALICSCSSDDSNSSEKWIEVNSNTFNDLVDVEFLNENFGVIGGGIGTLLKTEDGGKNWQPLNVGLNDSFFKVFILSENDFFTSRIGIYRTKDGGETFVELGNSSGFGSSIFDIHFFDSSNGIICKSGTLYKTSDGGNSWNNVYNEFGFANKLMFPSNKVGYLGGGNNFDNVNFGELHKTIDGGENWSEITLPSEMENSNITSIYFLTENIGYLSNVNNNLYTTKNGGLHWNKISSNHNFRDMVFIDELTGYAIGGSSIFKTENGGLDWAKDYNDNQIILSSITKTPNNRIFAVGNNGKILSMK